MEEGEEERDRKVFVIGSEKVKEESFTMLLLLADSRRIRDSWGRDWWGPFHERERALYGRKKWGLSPFFFSAVPTFNNHQSHLQHHHHPHISLYGKRSSSFSLKNSGWWIGDRRKKCVLTYTLLRERICGHWEMRSSENDRHTSRRSGKKIIITKWKNKTNSIFSFLLF